MALAIIAAGCGSAHHARPRRASLHRCLNTATATGPRLSGVRTSMVGGFSSTAFGVVTTADGQWSFVTLGEQLAVLSDRGFAPRVVRVVPRRSGLGLTPSGEALSPGDRYLLAADGNSGAAVFTPPSLTGFVTPASSA